MRYTLAAVFKALSDPTRLRLISLLTHQEFCVGDLAAALDASQSVVSHQLRDMRRMGWVRNRREGRHVYYALDDEHVRSLFEQAMAHTQDYQVRVVSGDRPSLSSSIHEYMFMFWRNRD